MPSSRFNRILYSTLRPLKAIRSYLFYRERRIFSRAAGIKPRFDDVDVTVMSVKACKGHVQN